MEMHNVARFPLDHGVCEAMRVKENIWVFPDG